MQNLPVEESHRRPNARSHSPSTSPSHTSSYHSTVKKHYGSVVPQSKWQQLVVGASSAAGTTAAVVSEESMKCLKYCLSWLQYAVQHIEQQMTLLRNFLVSLATAHASPTLTAPGTPTNAPSPVLSTIKKDIVETLRKVVDVISRYAGSSLPQHAKVTVRGFILNLPGRWASLNDIHSTTTSPASSPMLGPRLNGSDTPHTAPVETKRHEETAIRLLTFGQESVDMLQSITDVFSDTVERAEVWLDRLRLVRVPGISAAQDRKHANHPPYSENEDDLDNVRLPPIRTLEPNHYPFDRSEKMELDR